MGKNRKGYNWKAREVKQTLVDNSDTAKIKLEIESKDRRYDESNQFVLPSNKRKTKVKKAGTTATKILSKKQRKRLEKIVEKKKKKENRAQLLESLSKVQADPEEMSQLTSIAALQTKGLKRHFLELEKGVTISSKMRRLAEADGSENSASVSSMKGIKWRKAPLKGKLNQPENLPSGPNVVGFEVSSDESDGSHKDEESESDNEDVKEEHDSDKEEHDDVKKEDSTSSKDDISSQGPPEKLSPEPNPESGPNLEEEEEKEEPSTERGMAPKIPHRPSVPAVFVPVNRKKKIQDARMKLPILAEEQTVMEAISENPVVIIAGETGSGKTTQVPQFLFEAGYARNDKMIGITEPRRVAAVSMSHRVGEEMSLSSKEVSYVIRFEDKSSDKTKIKFMTDGVLLKEIQNDFLLSKYSVIVLDEAHERSVYTDILIGLLSRIVPLRLKRNNPFKLIIMSATLRLEDFTENSRLFRVTPPVIKVDARQFPVTIHFNRRTNEDYSYEAFRKCCKIHSQLPEGGILVFLTGQKEVDTLVKKLRNTFPMNKNKGKADENGDEIEEELDAKLKRSRKRKKSENNLHEINLDNYSTTPANDTEASDDELSQDIGDDIDSIATSTQPMWVLPLYSKMDTKSQAKVFQPPPEGCRLCVVATNVAETSLTIPNVKYVVDCGKWKPRIYDKVTGVSSFTVEWCSKASANQRAGRAGRTGPGHCYRLYSSAVFNDSFPLFSTPEIQRKPVDYLVLQMKSMGIFKVTNFPFPSPPDLTQIKTAERRLSNLGALESPKNADDEFKGKISTLGKTIASYPVDPRFGRMLALSHQHGLLALTIRLVAALSVQEVLQKVPVSQAPGATNSGTKFQWNQIRRKWAGVGNSKLLGDPMILLRATLEAEYAKENLEAFCSSYGLRFKAVVEIRKLCGQIDKKIRLKEENNDDSKSKEAGPDDDEEEAEEDDDAELESISPPTDVQSKLLRQIVLSGMVNQVAKKVDLNDLKEGEDKRKWKHAYMTPDMEEPVFMHSSSVLRKHLPEWVVYQEIFEENKMYMRGVTAIEPEWLPVFAPALCNISEPLLIDFPPRYDEQTERLLCHVSSTFGRSGWPLPIIEMEFPSGLNRFKWFARFFLEGLICPKLAKYTKHLLSTPATMVKTWAKLQSRTEVFLQELVSRKVDSTLKLREAWKENPKYLLDSYKQWLPISAHHEVDEIWPPDK